MGSLILNVFCRLRRRVSWTARRLPVLLTALSTVAFASEVADAGADPEAEERALDAPVEIDAGSDTARLDAERAGPSNALTVHPRPLWRGAEIGYSRALAPAFTLDASGFSGTLWPIERLLGEASVERRAASLGLGWHPGREGLGGLYVGPRVGLSQTAVAVPVSIPGLGDYTYQLDATAADLQGTIGLRRAKRLVIGTSISAGARWSLASAENVEGAGEALNGTLTALRSQLVGPGPMPTFDAELEVGFAF